MEHLTCAICLGRVVVPTMCPKCAKIFCSQCLHTAHRTTPNCPHCRQFLRVEAFVRIPWLADVQARLASLTEPNADECTLHPEHRLSNYCSTCKKCICSICWDLDHKDHALTPIEAIHASKKQRVADCMEVAANRQKQVGAIKDGLTNFRNQHQLMKEDGHLRIEELKREMLERFDMDCAAVYRPAERVDELELLLDNHVRDIKDALESSKLNRLVDKSDQWIRGFIPPDLAADVEMAKAHPKRMSERLDALHLLKPWIPDWDVKEKVVFKNCRRIMFHETGAIQTCKIKDVTWNVCVGKRENESSPSASSSSSYPNGLLIFAYMEGTDHLKNYEIAIESARVPEGNNRPPRSTILRRNALSEGEKVYFSLEDPRQWVSDKGELSFFFMVRPLTYVQKCRDLEEQNRILNRKLRQFQASMYADELAVCGPSSGPSSSSLPASVDIDLPSGPSVVSGPSPKNSKGIKRKKSKR